MKCADFTVFDVDQRSPEWLAIRAGLATGSAAPAIVKVRQKGTGELKVRADLRQRIVCERLTEQSLDRSFQRTPDAIQHGIDVEPDAVAAYELATDLVVHRVGFVKHNALAAGCSPDGFVGQWDGIVECKCPTSLTHLEYVQAGVIPEEYQGQLIHSLFITGAAWVDFVSFDPRFPEPLRLFIRRLNRADVDLVAYELALRTFLMEVDKAEAQARALMTVEAVA